MGREYQRTPTHEWALLFPCKQVAAEKGTPIDVCRTLRVVPLFETLEDLDNGGPVMTRLLSLPW